MSTTPLLLHDNAPAYKAVVAKVALRNCEFEELSDPLYSPNQTPCDFHLFTSLKGHLHGKHFEDNSKLNTVTEEWVQGKDKTKTLYFSGIEKIRI